MGLKIKWALLRIRLEGDTYSRFLLKWKIHSNFKIMTSHVMEITLAILKPDLVARARDLQVSKCLCAI